MHDEVTPGVPLGEPVSGSMSATDRRNLLLFIAFVVVMIAVVGVVWAMSTGSDGDGGGGGPTTTVFEYLGRRCPEWQVGLSMGATEDGLRRICMPGGFVWGDR